MSLKVGRASSRAGTVQFSIRLAGSLAPPSCYKIIRPFCPRVSLLPDETCGGTGGRPAQKDADAREERQAAEQRIATGENFSAIGLQRRHRPHAGQNHRRIDEGIHPRHWLEGAITDHPDAERDRDDQQANAALRARRA